MKNKLLVSLVILGMFILPNMAFAQTTVSGSVKGSTGGEPLIGATVVIKGTTSGTTTDLSGEFELSTTQNAPFTIVVSYIGFNNVELEITGNASGLSISLDEGTLLTDEVVISASRKVEKVQEAPASISVLTAKHLEGSPQVDPIRSLINIPGVQIQQQSASRMNIEMRGASGVFGTSVFPLMDYRGLVGPGIGTFQSDASGLNNIDLQRIEVVRGPGSALYGPGVTAGVVHFITKNPIDYPGTTIELMGGELNTFGVSARHATASSSGKFGFKINAHYKKGDEFTLDPNDADDAIQIAKFKTSINKPGVTNGVLDPTAPGTELLSLSDLDPDGDGNMMQDNWWNAAVNATLEFRPNDETTVFVSGGYNQSSSVFYNSQGEGLFQATEYWTQARMQMGGLFAQLFYVSNDGGSDENPTFLYQTGNVAGIGRTQLEGQIQYNFSLPSFLNADITTGFDYRRSGQETEHLVYGRNEDDDDYSIYGGYVQGKFALADKFDLVLAGRYDQFNFLDQGEFSPRAAVVFKASPKHTFRGSFNRASDPTTALEVNIDFPVNVPAPGIFDLWLQGNKEARTFNNFRSTGLFDVSIPGVPDLPYALVQAGLGIPLAIPYGAVTPAILAGFQAQIGVTIDQATYDLVASILTNPANAPQGTSGTLSGYNIFTGEPLSPIDAPSSAVSILDTWEVGYKGKFMDKLDVTLDIYRTKASNFTLFTTISPTIGLFGEDIANDLGTEVAAIAHDAIYAAVLSQFPDPTDPVAIGTAQGTADALAPVIGGAYNQGGAGFVAAAGPLFPIFGTVETDSAPDDGVAHNALGYRTFGEINYWGSDLGLIYQASNELSLFFNFSWLNQTEFSGSDLGEPEGSSLSYSLGAPKTKFRFGGQYSAESGLRGNLSFQHDQSFKADFGQYSGETDEKNLIDMGIGYKLENGLTIDLTGTNVFNNEYRAFPNMPKIGRRMLAKVTYSF